MLNYLDIYKSRMEILGGNPVGARVESSKQLINGRFEEDPSYREGRFVNPLQEHGLIDLRIINVDKSVEEKKIYLRPESYIDEGTYIYYDFNKLNRKEKIYIAEEFEDNLESPMIKGLKCNSFLKLEGLPQYFELGLPCNVTNDSYGSKTNLTNNYINDVAVKCKITLQDNEFSRKIKHNQRFIFNNSEYDIYSVIDITTVTHEGIMYLICQKDKYLNGLDDLENGKAFNDHLNEVYKDTDTLYELTGKEDIRVGQVEVYTIAPLLSNIKYVIDDTTVAEIVEEVDGSCAIRGLKKGEPFELTAIDGDGKVIKSRVLYVVR